MFPSYQCFCFHLKTLYLILPLPKKGGVGPEGLCGVSLSRERAPWSFPGRVSWPRLSGRGVMVLAKCKWSVSSFVFAKEAATIRLYSSKGQRRRRPGCGLRRSLGAGRGELGFESRPGALVPARSLSGQLALLRTAEEATGSAQQMSFKSPSGRGQARVPKSRESGRKQQPPAVIRTSSACQSSSAQTGCRGVPSEEQDFTGHWAGRLLTKWLVLLSQPRSRVSSFGTG